MNIGKRLAQVSPSIIRHFTANNMVPYERMLKEIRARGDIWMTSQGEYMGWWLKRDNAALRITVSEGQVHVCTELENAVIEQVSGEFLDTDIINCPSSDYCGEVWITIDRRIERKDLLIEILKREGILNYRIADDGDFCLSDAELGEKLAEIEASAIKRKGKFWEADIADIRQLVADKLATRSLPLLRVWYHPRIDGVVMQAVFSPRYDVDRAITNMAHIRALENKYNVNSTLYIRAFCPFYTDEAVAELAASSWCSELVVHGEFVTYARKYGSEAKAAVAERQHLIAVTGHPILGVGMHGGELTNNRTENTNSAVQDAGFLYDTTPRPAKDFLPSRKLIDGKLSDAFTLSHALGDIEIEANRNYGRAFYDRTMAKMDEIYEKNGVFVLMLHPVYFGFFTYLSRLRNWSPLLKFSMGYIKTMLS